MKSEFITAVEKQEVSRVRMMLSNELLLDPRGVTFSEMLHFAIKNLPTLFEQNTLSNYDVPIDKSYWDDSLCSKVKRDLNSNFSAEKLELFQEIAMWIGKEKAEKIDEEEKKQQEQQIHSPIDIEINNENARSRTKKICGTIAIIGGAILTISAIGAEKVFLSIIGGSAIVVGGIVLYSSKKINYGRKL